jgi:hypothetical protein
MITIINRIIELSKNFDIAFNSDKNLAKNIVIDLQKIKNMCGDNNELSFIIEEIIKTMEDMLDIKKPTHRFNDSKNTLIFFYDINFQYAYTFAYVWKNIKQNKKFNMISLDISIDKYKKVANDFKITNFPALLIITPNGEKNAYYGDYSLESVNIFMNLF